MLALLCKGGWVMFPLMVCSLVAVTITVERLVFFYLVNQGERRTEELLTLVEAGQLSEARDTAMQLTWPAAKVLNAGLAYRSNPEKAMEVAALGEVAALKRGLPVLETIITLSPLLGLLGTIIGMIGSFQIMAQSGSAQPHAVTGGVAEALIATASGIGVAVTTLIPYNYFLARVDKETTKIERYATRLEMLYNPLSWGSGK